MVEPLSSYKPLSKAAIPYKTGESLDVYFSNNYYKRLNLELQPASLSLSTAISGAHTFRQVHVVEVWRDLYNHHLTANLLENLPREFCKSVKI